MHFLDRVPLRRDDPKIVQLHEIFIRAYSEDHAAIALAGQVGVQPADIERWPKMRFTWWSILEESAKEGQLRKLVDVALRDPMSENWHVKIREVIDLPAGRLMESTHAEPQTPEEKRKAAQSPEVGSFASLWDPGTTLHVRFLDGGKRIRKKVEDAAMPWISDTNLKFEFGDNPGAQVRISFKKQGSWAVQGTTALSIPPNEPTVNFGWLKDNTPQDEVDRVVLHEFGHVLGLQHEHGNPASTLKWKKDEVYRYYSQIQGWDREKVDRFVFAIWPPAYFPVHKVFDPDSIMMFPMEAKFLAAGKPIGWNRTLSAVDRQFAAALYPLRKIP